MKKDLPITIDWDAQWPSEFLFQHIACWLIRHCTPRVHALDTSRLAAPGRGTPDNVEAPSQHGAPDIVACVDGDYVTIELKSARGEQSKHQGHEQDRVTAAGGRYVLARTMRDVFDALGLEVPE